MSSINGKICYVEMPARNVGESARFYEQVFGWRTRQRGDGATAFDDTTGEVSGTWVLDRRAWSEPGLLFYIMVDDLDTTVRAVTARTAASSCNRRASMRRRSRRAFAIRAGTSSGCTSSQRSVGARADGAARSHTSRRIPMQTDVILKRFEQPDEVRELVKGRFEIVRLGGLTIGRATYQPGWRWSEHVGPALGQARCSVEHVGLVVSGTATAAFADGRVVELRAGELFYIPPEPHDSWVIGDEPYVSLHFLGADHYAR